jgi:hypothetical protein
MSRALSGLEVALLLKEKFGNLLGVLGPSTSSRMLIRKAMGTTSAMVTSSKEHVAAGA